LKELLRDPRLPGVRRHLRKIYVDPMTGKAEWGIVYLGEKAGVLAVYSLSNAKPVKIGNFPQRFAGFEGKQKISEWRFEAVRKPDSAGGAGTATTPAASTSLTPLTPLTPAAAAAPGTTPSQTQPATAPAAEPAPGAEPQPPAPTATPPEAPPPGEPQVEQPAEPAPEEKKTD
jgi:hypothetical protein